MATKSGYWAVVLTSALIIGGCGSGSSGSSPGDRLGFEKKMGADESKAKSFVASLAALPFSDRVNYAKTHPEEVQNMAKIPDPSLQRKFRNLMLNRG